MFQASNELTVNYIDFATLSYRAYTPLRTTVIYSIGHKTQRLFGHNALLRNSIIPFLKLSYLILQGTLEHKAVIQLTLVR